MATFLGSVFAFHSPLRLSNDVYCTVYTILTIIGNTYHPFPIEYLVTFIETKAAPPVIYCETMSIIDSIVMIVLCSFLLLIMFDYY